MTAQTMAGEWPANIGWRVAAAKARHNRRDPEDTDRRAARGKSRRQRPERDALVALRLMARHGGGHGGGPGAGRGGGSGAGRGGGPGAGRGRPDKEDLERLAVLRHLRGGGPGGPRGGGPFGGGGRGRGRRRRGDVRAALLLLLAEEPRNGYQLMQTIEERSGGRWRPSPGSVYPSLSQLEDEGFVRSIERDGAKLFEITDAGREHVAERHDQAAPWDLRDDAAGETLHELRSMIPEIAAAVWQVSQVGDQTQVRKASELLAETRRNLYRILADDGPADAAPGSDEPDERVPSGDDE